MSTELSELRKEVGEIRETVARTDANVGWLRNALVYQVERSDKQEARIGRLERWQAWIAGAAAAVGAVLGFGAGNQLKG
jgi:hypothetical protein